MVVVRVEVGDSGHDVVGNADVFEGSEDEVSGERGKGRGEVEEESSGLGGVGKEIVAEFAIDVDDVGEEMAAKDKTSLGRMDIGGGVLGEDEVQGGGEDLRVSVGSAEGASVARVSQTVVKVIWVVAFRQEPEKREIEARREGETVGKVSVGFMEFLDDPGRRAAPGCVGNAVRARGGVVGTLDGGSKGLKTWEEVGRGERAGTGAEKLIDDRAINRFSLKNFRPVVGKDASDVGGVRGDGGDGVNTFGVGGGNANGPDFGGVFLHGLCSSVGGETRARGERGQGHFCIMRRIGK